MIAGKNAIYRQMLLSQQMRAFGVLPKLPRVELTMRTPYRTIFKDFGNFSRVYVHSIKGYMGIGNKSIPRVYLLPPGQVTVKGANPGEGNFATNESGCFMHGGGWLFVHDNNSIECNFLECVEKEDVKFDKLEGLEPTESESNAGIIARQLQEKTVKLIQRRR